jgi:hypothetical protein
MQEVTNPNMQTTEVYNLLRVPQKMDKETTLRQAWSLTHTSCKDVVALACPLKPLPTSLEAFKKMMSEHTKQQDFVMCPFHIIFVGRCDGQQYGWSKAPYDAKNKKKEDQKLLYTLDENQETKFWSFKKVSNNMNKGARVERTEEKDGFFDLSFVLKPGTCFSTFLREENFEEQKSMFSGIWNSEGVLAAYKPVLLQLSCTNEDQALKGNGFKLRSFAPAPEEILKDFYDCFSESPSELHALQSMMSEHISLRTITKPNKSSPILCKIDQNAFIYKEPETEMLEIVNSGFADAMGKKVLMNVKVLLQATNSQDVDRTLRMLSVAIAHNAVRCLIATQEYIPGTSSDASIVVHLDVDFAEAMWLNMLHKSRFVDAPTSLPKTSMLTMCYGKSIFSGNSLETTPGMYEKDNFVQYLQWYSPNNLVQVADKEGEEYKCHVVFEMMLVSKQSAGQRDVNQKLLFMDEVSGFHYVIKVYHTKKVNYSEENGLMCSNPTLLLTWQLRPGCPSSSMSVPSSGRKRVQMLADALDLMNSGDFVHENDVKEKDLMIDEENDLHEQEQAIPTPSKKRNKS